MFPEASPAVVAGLGITQGLPLRLKMADGWCTPRANEGGAGPVLTTNKDVDMLILSRRIEQVICIGDDIEVMVTKIGPNSVRIGINAPKHINIARKELRIEAAEVEDSDCD